jgi:hypothetical protein
MMPLNATIGLDRYSTEALLRYRGTTRLTSVKVKSPNQKNCARWNSSNPGLSMKKSLTGAWVVLLAGLGMARLCSRADDQAT